MTIEEIYEKIQDIDDTTRRLVVFMLYPSGEWEIRTFPNPKNIRGIVFERGMIDDEFTDKED